LTLLWTRSFTETEKSSKYRKIGVSYGEYLDVSPLSVLPIQIHIENNTPLIHLTKATKSIQVKKYISSQLILLPPVSFFICWILWIFQPKNKYKQIKRSLIGEILQWTAHITWLTTGHYSRGSSVESISINIHLSRMERMLWIHSQLNCLTMPRVSGIETLLETSPLRMRLEV